MNKREASKPNTTAETNQRAVKASKSNRRKGRLSLDPPLIRPAGRRIRITNEQIYELIEFP